jgi:hypothetical protein
VLSSLVASRTRWVSLSESVACCVWRVTDSPCCRASVGATDSEFKFPSRVSAAARAATSLARSDSDSGLDSLSRAQRKRGFCFRRVSDTAQSRRRAPGPAGAAQPGCQWPVARWRAGPGDRRPAGPQADSEPGSDLDSDSPATVTDCAGSGPGRAVEAGDASGEAGGDGCLPVGRRGRIHWPGRGRRPLRINASLRLVPWRMSLQ